MPPTKRDRARADDGAGVCLEVDARATFPGEGRFVIFSTDKKKIPHDDSGDVITARDDGAAKSEDAYAAYRLRDVPAGFELEFPDDSGVVDASERARDPASSTRVRPRGASSNTSTRRDEPPSSRGVMELWHTFTPPAKRGRGLAKIVVDAALRCAALNGLTVDATCSYAKRAIEELRREAGL